MKYTAKMSHSDLKVYWDKKLLKLRLIYQCYL